MHSTPRTSQPKHDKHENRVLAMFALAAAFIALCTLVLGIFTTRDALVPIAWATPFALFLFWQSLHVRELGTAERRDDATLRARKLGTPGPAPSSSPHPLPR